MLQRLGLIKIEDGILKLNEEQASKILKEIPHNPISEEVLGRKNVEGVLRRLDGKSVEEVINQKVVPERTIATLEKLESGWFREAEEERKRKWDELLILAHKLGIIRYIGGVVTFVDPKKLDKLLEIHPSIDDSYRAYVKNFILSLRRRRLEELAQRRGRFPEKLFRVLKEIKDLYEKWGRREYPEDWFRTHSSSETLPESTPLLKLLQETGIINIEADPHKRWIAWVNGKRLEEIKQILEEESLYYLIDELNRAEKALKVFHGNNPYEVESKRYLLEYRTGVDFDHLARTLAEIYSVLKKREEELIDKRLKKIEEEYEKWPSLKDLIPPDYKPSSNIDLDKVRETLKKTAPWLLNLERVGAIIIVPDRKKGVSIRVRWKRIENVLPEEKGKKIKGFLRKIDGENPLLIAIEDRKTYEELAEELGKRIYLYENPELTKMLEEMGVLKIKNGRVNVNKELLKNIENSRRLNVRERRKLRGWLERIDNKLVNEVETRLRLRKDDLLPDLLDMIFRVNAETKVEKEKTYRENREAPRLKEEFLGSSINIEEGEKLYDIKEAPPGLRTLKVLHILGKAYQDGIISKKYLQWVVENAAAEDLKGVLSRFTVGLGAIPSERIKQLLSLVNYLVNNTHTHPDHENIIAYRTLRCPACGGRLKTEEEGFRCSKCGAFYKEPEDPNNPKNYVEVDPLPEELVRIIKRYAPYQIVYPHLLPFHFMVKIEGDGEKPIVILNPRHPLIKALREK